MLAIITRQPADQPTAVFHNSRRSADAYIRTEVNAVSRAISERSGILKESNHRGECRPFLLSMERIRRFVRGKRRIQIRENRAATVCSSERSIGLICRQLSMRYLPGLGHCWARKRRGRGTRKRLETFRGMFHFSRSGGRKSSAIVHGSSLLLGEGNLARARSAGEATFRRSGSAFNFAFAIDGRINTSSNFEVDVSRRHKSSLGPDDYPAAKCIAK